MKIEIIYQNIYTTNVKPGKVDRTDLKAKMIFLLPDY